MKHLIFIRLLLCVVCWPSIAAAELVVEGADRFVRNVDSNLSQAKNHSPSLAELIHRIEGATATITIRPITQDRSTWHASGKKSRSHTLALDNLPRGAKRAVATDSIIYINTNRISQSHKTYASGTLIHELVHAYDLAVGQYHGRYPIREKRAVFFQNIWREIHGKALRTDYHGRFTTNEYQTAKRDGEVEPFVRFYFNNNGLP